MIVRCPHCRAEFTVPTTPVLSDRDPYTGELVVAAPPASAIVTPPSDAPGDG